MRPAERVHHPAPPALPSAATVSRRARRVVFGVFPNRVAAALRGGGGPAREVAADGKPLPVGRCSEGPDARAGPHGKGYKRHAVWGGRCVPEAWAVTAASRYEGAVAREPPAGVRGRGVLPADGNSEAGPVSDAAAAAGYQLVAPPDPGDDGAGHRPRSPHRRVALDWCRAGPGRDLLRERAAIERRFGNLTSFAGGPGPLPGWVRRRGRVERWVWCKLAVNAARITRNQRQQMGQMQ